MTRMQKIEHYLRGTVVFKVLPAIDTKVANRILVMAAVQLGLLSGLKQVGNAKIKKAR